MMHDINLNQLPTLSEEYEITDIQRQYFREKGHIMLKSVATLSSLTPIVYSRVEDNVITNRGTGDV